MRRFLDKTESTVLAVIVALSLVLGQVPVGAFAFASDQAASNANTEQTAQGGDDAKQPEAKGSEKPAKSQASADNKTDSGASSNGTASTAKEGTSKEEPTQGAPAEEAAAKEEAAKESPVKKGSAKENPVKTDKEDATSKTEDDEAAKTEKGKASAKTETKETAKAAGAKSASDDIEISSVTFSITPPAAGDSSTSSPEVTVTGDGIASTSASWESYYGYGTGPDEFSFEEGQSYYAYASVKASDGYTFKQGSKITSGVEETWYNFDGTCSVSGDGATLYKTSTKKFEGDGSYLRIWVQVTATASSTPAEDTFFGVLISDTDGTVNSGGSYTMDFAGNERTGQIRSATNNFVASGETVVLTATADDDFNFVGWFQGDPNGEQGSPIYSGSALSTNPRYEFTAPIGLNPMYVCAVFAPSTIKSVSLTVTPPVAGTTSETPPEVTLEEGAPYEVSSCSWTFDNGESLPVTFEANTAYKASVTLKAADGYEFSFNVDCDCGNATLLSHATMNMSGVSRHSIALRVTATEGDGPAYELPAPTNLTWVSEGAEWDRVADADEYLFECEDPNGDTMTAYVSNPDSVSTISFLVDQFIGDVEGDFTFAVTALADNRTKTSARAESEPKYFYETASCNIGVNNRSYGSATVAFTTSYGTDASADVNGGVSFSSKKGSDVTLVATPAGDDYALAGWYTYDPETSETGELVSTSATYTFTADADTKLCAVFGPAQAVNFKFQQVAEYDNVSSLTLNGEEVAISGEGLGSVTVASGTPVSIVLTPKEGYACGRITPFSAIDDYTRQNASDYSTTTATFTQPEKDVTILLAVRDRIAVVYDVNGGTKGSDWPENDLWQYTPAGIYMTSSIAAPVELDPDFAAPPSGMKYAGYQIEDTVLYPGETSLLHPKTSPNPLPITILWVSEDTDLPVLCGMRSEAHGSTTMNYTNDQGSSKTGSVSGNSGYSSYVQYGTEVTVSAAAEDGYALVGWYEYDPDTQTVGELVSSNVTYTYTATEPTYLKAVFAPATTLTVSFQLSSDYDHVSSLTVNGNPLTITQGKGSVEVAAGQPVTVVVTSKTGYMVSNAKVIPSIEDYQRVNADDLSSSTITFTQQEETTLSLGISEKIAVTYDVNGGEKGAAWPDDDLYKYVASGNFIRIEVPETLDADFATPPEGMKYAGYQIGSKTIYPGDWTLLRATGTSNTIQLAWVSSDTNLPVRCGVSGDAHGYGYMDYTDETGNIHADSYGSHGDGSVFSSLVQYGSDVTMRGVPDEGYALVGWYEYDPDTEEVGQLVSTSTNYTYTATDKTYLKAKFAPSRSLTVDFLCEDNSCVGNIDQYISSVTFNGTPIPVTVAGSAGAYTARATGNIAQGGNVEVVVNYTADAMSTLYGIEAKGNGFSVEHGGDIFNTVTATFTASESANSLWLENTFIPAIGITYDINGGTPGEFWPANDVEKIDASMAGDYALLLTSLGSSYYASAPEDTVFAGFEITDATGTQTVPADQTTIEGLDFSAGGTVKWLWAGNHTVTFDTNGADTETPAQQTVVHGGHAAKPADPTKDQLHFLGWYEKEPADLTRAEVYNPYGGFKFANTPVTEDIELHAVWYADLEGVMYDITNPANPTISNAYYSRGGAATWTSTYQCTDNPTTQWYSYSTIQDSTVTMTAHPFDGYEFIGWSTSSSADDIVSTNSTYKFTFTGKTKICGLFASTDRYLCTSRSDGGTLEVQVGQDGHSDDGLMSNFTGTKGDRVTLTATAGDGYEFVGFYEGIRQMSADEPNVGFVTDYDSTKLLSENSTYTFTLDDDTNVYALFQETVTITFNGNGGQPESTDVVIPKGGKVENVPTFTNNPNYVMGWYDNPNHEGNPINLSTATFDEGKTLYAAWGNTVDFYAAGNGAYGKVQLGNYNPSSHLASHMLLGESKTMKAVPADGYRFVKWAKGSADGGTYSTDPEIEFTYDGTVDKLWAVFEVFTPTLTVSCSASINVTSMLSSVTVNGQNLTMADPPDTGLINVGSTVQGSTQIEAGTPVTVIVTPTSNATVLGYDALSIPYTASMGSDGVLTMSFEMPDENVSFDASLGPAVSVAYDVNGGTRGANWPAGDVVKLPISLAVTGISISADTFGGFADPPTGFAYAGLEVTHDGGTSTVAPGETLRGAKFTNGGTVKWLWGGGKTITFDPNATNYTGTMDPVTVAENADYELPECEFNANWKLFDHWEVTVGDSQSVDKNPGQTVTITDDTTVKAIWKDASMVVIVIAKDGIEDSAWNHVTVTLDGTTVSCNDNTVNFSTKIAADSTHTITIAPKTGYTLTSASLGTTPADIDADGKATMVVPIVDNPKLFIASAMVAPVYTVSFDTNGAEPNEMADQKVVYGGKAKEPTVETNEAAPQKGNLVLRDWYKDVYLTEPFDFANDTITSNTTLYAGWDVPVKLNVVNLDADIVNGTGGTATITYDDVTINAPTEEFAYLPEGKTVTLTATPDADGHFVFNSWRKGTTADSQAITTTPEGEQGKATCQVYVNQFLDGVTINALFELESHTVTFNARGGTPAPADQVVKHGQKATEPTSPDKTVSRPDGDYQAEFQCWSTYTDEYTEDFRFDEAAITEDTTLNAFWSYQTFVYAYDAATSTNKAGGKVCTHGDDFIPWSVVGKMEGVSTTMRAQPDDNRIFRAWVYGEDKDQVLSTSATYTDSIENLPSNVYALFDEPHVTFNAGEGTAGTGFPEETTTAANESWVWQVPEYPLSADIATAPADKHFAGVEVTHNGETETYAPGEIASIYSVSADIAVKFLWADNPTVTLRWSSVDGVDLEEPIQFKAAPGTTIGDAIDEHFGTSQSLSYSPFEKDGYQDWGYRLPEPLTEYASAEELLNAMISPDTVLGEDGMVIYYTIFKELDSVELTIASPICGTEVSTPFNDDPPEGGDPWDWDNQTNRPVASVPDNTYYSLLASNNANWSFWCADERGDDAFSGTIEGGEQYYAGTWVCGYFGYTFADDTVCTVNGNDAAIIMREDNALACIAPVEAVHVEGAAKHEDEVEPTCTEKGSYNLVIRCEECDTVISSEAHEVDALGHEWDEGTVTTEPTCTEPGVKTYTCKHNPKHTKTKTLAALGHDWGEWTVTKEATDEEAGIETRECGRCHKTETRPIDKLDVSYRIVSGDGATWTKGTSSGLSFTYKRSINDGKTFDMFDYATIDGKKLPDAAMITARGSLVLTVLPGYLENLSTGTHSIEVSFLDANSVTASFNIKDKTSSDSDDQAQKHSGTSKYNSSKGGLLNKTGDATLPIAVTLVVVAVLAAGIAWFARRKMR